MSKRILRKAMLFVGGGSLALLLFLCSVTGLQAATDKNEEGEKAIVLETLDVEAQEETERTILDLEQSFEESFIREKVFSEQIERESISDVKAAIKAMPNVTIQEFGGFSSSIEIRGLSGDRVISVIDGVGLSNQGLTYRGGGDINMVDIGTVDSIEVIKGSPSVVYDPGASGGIILVKTKPIAEEDHLRLRTTFLYDDGREKTRESVYLSGAKHGFGAALSYSQSDAKGYKVRNEEKLQEAINRTNNSEEQRTGSDRLTNLGFQDESLTLDMNYLFSDRNHSLSFKHSDFEVENSISIIPALEPILFTLPFLSRESDQILYQIKKLGIFRDLHLAVADQSQFRATETISFLLESQSANGSTELTIQNTKVVLGGKVNFDHAETAVLADQNEWGGYINAEHRRGKLTYIAGIRGNRWDLESEENPLDISVRGLEGFLINPVSKEESALTYGGGLVYSLTENNNLSLNYSRIHRFPSLFERFAPPGNIRVGCHIVGGDCKSEEADSFDAAWKFYDGLFSASFSIFYSDFDNYIAIKQRRRIVDHLALDACVNSGRCNPLIGDYDGRENDFFATDFPYFNIKRVVNRGFEVSLKRVREDDYEAGLSFGLSEFDVREVYDPIERKLFVLPSNPLEFNFHYIRHFPGVSTKPWVKLAGRYVTNTPGVDQKPDGFSAFFKADLFFGFKYILRNNANLVFNSGVRNLTDKIYHEPDSPLDGIKRSFFFNVTFEIV